MSAKSKSGLTQPKCFKASDLEMELRGLFHPNHSVVLPSIQFSVAYNLSAPEGAYKSIESCLRPLKLLTITTRHRSHSSFMVPCAFL